MAETVRGRGKAAGWREWLPSAGLLSIVLTLLMLGAVLETDPETAETTPAQDPAPPAPASTAAPAAGGLDERARRDLERAGAADGPWTLQLLYSCDRDNASRLVQRFGDEDRLMVIPLTDGGRACWRFCWGRFADRAVAVSDPRLPPHLRSAFERPQPRRIEELLP